MRRWYCGVPGGLGGRCCARGRGSARLWSTAPAEMNAPRCAGNLLGKAAFWGAHGLDAWPGSARAAGERLRRGTLREACLASVLRLLARRRRDVSYSSRTASCGARRSHSTASERHRQLTARFRSVSRSAAPATQDRLSGLTRRHRRGAPYTHRCCAIRCAAPRPCGADERWPTSRRGAPASSAVWVMATGRIVMSWRRSEMTTTIL